MACQLTDVMFQASTPVWTHFCHVTESYTHSLYVLNFPLAFVVMFWFVRIAKNVTKEKASFGESWYWQPVSWFTQADGPRVCLQQPYSVWWIRTLLFPCKTTRKKRTILQMWNHRKNIMKQQQWKKLKEKFNWMGCLYKGNTPKHGRYASVNTFPLPYGVMCLTYINFFSMCYGVFSCKAILFFN